MAWIEPAYSRSAVRRAGATLIDPAASLKAHVEAQAIVQNWRSAHGFPLNSMQMVLRSRARRADPNALVAQRQKRLPSIITKLEHSPHPNLATMQDIGGARAIVAGVTELAALRDLYLQGRSRHELLTVDDYTWSSPKLSGYRGVHLVYKYRSRDKPQYNDLRIEIQLRTQMMHAWATAVETVDTFTSQALKSSRGSDEWLRFFALIASEIAFLENTAPVPGTPTSRDALRAEIRALLDDLDVIAVLTAYGRTLRITDDDKVQNAKFYVMIRDADGALTVIAYADQVTASSQYARFEADGDSDVVLVSVDSLATLRRAYPNYFLDTDRFLAILQVVLAS